MLRFVLCSSSLIYSRSQQHGTEIDFKWMQGMVGLKLAFMMSQIVFVPKAAVKNRCDIENFNVWGEVGNFSLSQHIYMERKQHKIAFRGYLNESRKFKISMRLRDLFSILNEFSRLTVSLKKGGWCVCLIYNFHKLVTKLAVGARAVRKLKDFLWVFFQT